VRFFSWQRWDGSFYVMMSVTDVGANTSKVYKQKIGTDATFQLLLTDATTSEAFDYVEANNFIFFGNGNLMRKYDGTTVTNWGINPQPASVATLVNTAAGNVPNSIGHRYIYTYGVSGTGYLSDVSDPSLVTTPGVTLRQWTVSGPFCADTQCNQIHIYRTEDGGSVYLELPNSPIANPGSGTWSIIDNAADSALQQAFPAPFPGVNDPPIPMLGFRFFAGRIWGFKGDTVYFSTYEENTTSVAEECFGQPRTNSRAFGSQVFGIAKTPEFLLVFTTRGIYRIGGDSLNTFAYSQLSHNMGVRNRATIAEFDDKVAWFDMSDTIQITDGNAIAKDDLSLAIRPDIENVPHPSARMAVYAVGKYKWLMFADGQTNRVWVYDLSLNQWNPAWTQIISGIGSVQTAAGVFKLLAGVFNGTNIEVRVVDHTTFADAGVPYAPESRLNLVQVNRDNPTSVGVLEYVGVERNNVALSDVGMLTDEDFTTGIYTSIFANETEPANRTNGVNLVEKWYWANTPSAQRVSVSLKWAAVNSKFILYVLDVISRKVN
jgi:hypothetical protein